MVKAMKNGIITKLKEAVFSILPVSLIMIIVSLILGFNVVTIFSIIISSFLLIIGICLFSFGAEISMIEIGSIMGSRLIKSKKPWLIAVVTFIVGIIITVAEPDLKVLADQMTAINNWTLIISVGVGVGLFLALAAMRIIYQWSLKWIMIIFYVIALILMLIVDPNMVPIAFDSGGVTTGPISVPFIIALGLGLSKGSSHKSAKDNSFGLVALCSIGPILIVLILGLIMKGKMDYTYVPSNELNTFSSLFSTFTKDILPVMEEVALSLIPIVLVFLIFNAITKSVKGRKLSKIFIGILATFIGLTLFFIGVNVGFMPNAYLIGIRMYTSYRFLLIPLGIIVGLLIVKAEPAVAVLTAEIEKITQGSMSKKVLNNTIALGVALAISLAMIRVLTGTPIIYFLLISYSLAIVLMLFTPELFTMVAFDSGGAVSGPMTTSFLLPLVIGICYAHNGNILTDAFGVVAFVAISPLLTIQILGLIFKIKSKVKQKHVVIDETIVDYDWKCQYE